MTRDAVCPNEDIKKGLALVPISEEIRATRLVPLNISTRRRDEVVTASIIQGPTVDLHIAGHGDVEFTCLVKDVVEGVGLLIIYCHVGTGSGNVPYFIFY